MDDAKELFDRLGVTKFEQHHLVYVANFIKKSRDAEELLTNLGSWEKSDLIITQKWMDYLNNKLATPKLKLF